ncbi:MAG TPA: DUF192 domain-containing protein [Verrucomicrobiae bacterium]|nr:DUF192 domain-containing protein [Verrucomicrobiae bacterium]
MKFVSPPVLFWLSLTLASCGQKPPASMPMPSSTPPPAASIPGWPATNAQPRLPTLKLQVGNQIVTAELCRRPLEIMTGMMFRTNMLEDEGMLFVLPFAQQASFYMKNTRVPLTVAYIDVDGRILELHDLRPLDETPIYAHTARVLYVLEMKQGWFARKGVVPGVTIVTEKGPLKDTVKFISLESEKGK